MKKLGILLVVLAVALVAIPVAAAPTAGSWTGWVTDSHCGVKGANDKHTAACLTKCVKEGSKVQFVNDADKKVYDIDKAHWDAATSHVGHMVKVTGSVDNGTVTVEKIEAAAAPSK
jgi:hypothetical protein